MFEYSKVACPEEIDSDSVFQICTWAREYGKAEDPGDFCMRFAIGVYQLKQMMDWIPGKYIKEKPLGAIQSAAACSIHVIAAAEMAGGDVATFMPMKFSEIPMNNVDWRELTYQLAVAQQQLVYIRQVSSGAYGKNNLRASRIDLHVLGRSVAGIVKIVFGQFHRESRSGGIEQECAILNKKQWRYEKGNLLKGNLLKGNLLKGDLLKGNLLKGEHADKS